MKYTLAIEDMEGSIEEWEFYLKNGIDMGDNGQKEVPKEEREDIEKTINNLACAIEVLKNED
jgi:hypothetical protein